MASPQEPRELPLRFFLVTFEVPAIAVEARVSRNWLLTGASWSLPASHSLLGGAARVEAPWGGVGWVSSDRARSREAARPHAALLDLII